MKFRWHNWQTGLFIIVVAVCACAIIPASSVREIHNTDRISNFAMADARPGSADWPWWRGSDSRNVAASDQIPLEWTANAAEGWQVTLPDRGQSTPCLWGDQLFLLTSDENGQRIFLQSHSRLTGQTAWRTELHHDMLTSVPDADSGISGSPACDGQYVYSAAAVHGTLWVTSVDLKGRIAWQRQAGPFGTQFSFRSSPALFKSLIIVAADQPSSGYIAAIHRQTGEIVWRVQRAKSDGAASPIVANIAGRPQLVLCGGKGITSYDPSSGSEIWTYRWPSVRAVNTVAFDGEHVFATSHGVVPEVVCIRADGSGDITKSHLLWRQTNVGCGIPSPVCHAGLVFVLADDGRLTCLNAETGKIEWRKRLEGSFTSSPVISGGLLICSNKTGLTTILQADPSGVVVAENKLPDGITATPIVVGNSIFLRTHHGLHYIAATASQTVVEKPDPPKRRI